MELLQNVEVELPLGTQNFRMITSCKLHLATLFMTEEVLPPMIIVDWIVAGCEAMPRLDPNKVEYTLLNLKQLQKEATFLLSPRFDYAKSTPTKEQPTAYAPPHRRFTKERTVRTIGTQTDAFELADWVQFQQYIRKE